MNTLILKESIVFYKNGSNGILEPIEELMFNGDLTVNDQYVLKCVKAVNLIQTYSDENLGIEHLARIDFPNKRQKEYSQKISYRGERRSIDNHFINVKLENDSIRIFRGEK